jgi:hypothetical protein
MQDELDTLKQQLRQTQAELDQTRGKLVAIERDSYETKRQAKLAQDQAKAQEQETANALLEASQQMKVALGVSQGIFALGQMGKEYIARKAASCRVVHREGQIMILMQQMMDAYLKEDKVAMDTAQEKAKAMIDTIRKDGEANRLQAAEAALAYGLSNFYKTFDRIVAEGNPVV